MGCRLRCIVSISRALLLLACVCAVPVAADRVQAASHIGFVHREEQIPEHPNGADVVSAAVPGNTSQTSNNSATEPLKMGADPAVSYLKTMTEARRLDSDIDHFSHMTQNISSAASSAKENSDKYRNLAEGLHINLTHFENDIQELRKQLACDNRQKNAKIGHLLSTGQDLQLDENEIKKICDGISISSETHLDEATKSITEKLGKSKATPEPTTTQDAEATKSTTESPGTSEAAPETTTTLASLATPLPRDTLGHLDMASESTQMTNATAEEMISTTETPATSEAAPKPTTTQEMISTTETPATSEAAPEPTTTQAPTDAQTELFRNILASPEEVDPLTDRVIREKIQIECEEKGFDCSMAIEYRKYCFEQGPDFPKELKMSLFIESDSGGSKDECSRANGIESGFLVKELDKRLPCGRFYVCNDADKKLVLTKDHGAVLTKEDPDQCQGDDGVGQSNRKLELICLPDLFGRANGNQAWTDKISKDTKDVYTDIKNILVKPLPPEEKKVENPKAHEKIFQNNSPEATCVCSGSRGASMKAVSLRKELLVGKSGNEPGKAPTIPDGEACACTEEFYKVFPPDVSNLFTGPEDICGGARTLYWVPVVEEEELRHHWRDIHKTLSVDTHAAYDDWKRACQKLCLRPTTPTIDSECHPPANH